MHIPRSLCLLKKVKIITGKDELTVSYTTKVSVTSVEELE